MKFEADKGSANSVRYSSPTPQPTWREELGTGGWE